MNERKALNGKRLASTDIEAAGVVQPGNRNEQKRIKKLCIGCADTFTCYQQDSYDYCRNCEINGSRYIPGRFKQNQCSECGNGSGWIKFKNQPIRACKLCSLQPRIIQKEVFHG